MPTTYLDAESTGLTRSDEVLELAIVGDSGETLFHSLIRPIRHTEWHEAEQIHGISPAMVADAPTLEQQTPAIREAVKNLNVVIYNAAYDASYLGEQLETAASIHCCMEAYAEYVGDWSEYHGSYRWQKLAAAARDVLHEWCGDAHRALSDALACRSVWRFLTVPAERERVEGLYRQRRLEHQARMELQRLDLQAVRRNQDWSKYMDGFIRSWWLKPNCEQHWVRLLNGLDREDALSRVFFGKSTAALDLEDQFETVYYRKKDIPDHLKPASHFNRAVWFQDELEASASYVGNKQAYMLYDESEAQRIVELYPLRFTSPDMPEGFEWVTYSTLKARGYSTEHIATLPPVAERQNPYSRDWYWLYQIKKS